MLQLMLGLRTLFGGAFDDVAAVAAAAAANGQPRADCAFMMFHFRVTRTSTSSRRTAYAVRSHIALHSYHVAKRMHRHISNAFNAYMSVLIYLLSA